jgi:hypothetical protein
MTAHVFVVAGRILFLWLTDKTLSGVYDLLGWKT